MAALAVPNALPGLVPLTVFEPVGVTVTVPDSALVDASALVDVPDGVVDGDGATLREGVLDGVCDGVCSAVLDGDDVPLALPPRLCVDVGVSAEEGDGLAVVDVEGDGVVVDEGVPLSVADGVADELGVLVGLGELLIEVVELGVPLLDDAAVSEVVQVHVPVGDVVSVFVLVSDTVTVVDHVGVGEAGCDSVVDAVNELLVEPDPVAVEDGDVDSVDVAVTVVDEDALYEVVLDGERDGVLDGVLVGLLVGVGDRVARLTLEVVVVGVTEPLRVKLAVALNVAVGVFEELVDG